MLLDLRRELDQAIQGHAILEQKRETLLRELWDLFSEVKHTEGEVRNASREHTRYNEKRAWPWGWTLCGLRASLRPLKQNIHRARNMMGVALPLVNMRVTRRRFPTVPQALAGFRRASDQMGRSRPDTRLVD